MEEKNSRGTRLWHKPELIVLVRSRSEEAVLTACKMQFGQDGGPGWAMGCRFSPDCVNLTPS